MTFKLAVEQELIKNNPTTGAKVPKDRITVEEIENKEASQKLSELMRSL